MRKLPPLRALHAFEAAARHGSFKAAAEELSVTPTAISHQIRLLEETCGRPLFQRRPRPLVLTSAGARLFPALRDGFDVLAGAVAALSEPEAHPPLRVTSPSAFASRWLVPRLPKWREANPMQPLEIIGTDAVLDLRSGAADVAIRYARRPPVDFAAHEICRDTFFPVCSPGLLANDGGAIQRVADLLRLPLIHFDWMSRDPDAPTWRQWLTVARSIDPDLDTDRAWDLSFREEIHAIDAVVAGQGVAICSDIVVSRELNSGALVKAHPLALPGYGFYVLSIPHSSRAATIELFSNWMRSVI
ncbi:LysR substrate-binding domain-containing protein [Variovorax sp. Sphag1AA]|uniref:LysR substrate-binding domain-containing protein n=1 Tax=Variovorax sp. Sphag1AA TaxID=2587027 RepID=UPI00161BC279|nr:LysR substrate-binding domain-containing protein [Variovorax sp. Sphag1AA]MBB3178043.1 LysR family glycine cleavage system transcriptional activator [Variovorax sp. Sphag1AA]